MHEFPSTIFDSKVVSFKAGSRLKFLDGLRGLACLGVMLHHLYHCSELNGPLSTVFPVWLRLTCTYGALGVQVFFVLSGFVIALSLSRLQITSSTAVNFAIRRHVRLDPTYWCCLLLAMAISLVSFHVHPQLYTKPTFLSLATNMIYADGITGSTSLLGVSWTLCLEVQFYLIFICILFAGQYFNLFKEKLVVTSVTLILAIVSLYLRLYVFTDHFPWFIGSWYLFAMGAMSFWCLVGDMRSPVFLLFAISAITLGAVYRQNGVVCGAVVALIIYGVGRANYLTTLLSNPIIQYFGRISYSLYLIHLLILIRVYRVGIHLTGSAARPAICWFIVAGGLSIVAAHLIYYFVEAPTIRLAGTLKHGLVGTLHIERISAAVQTVDLRD